MHDVCIEVVMKVRVVDNDYKIQTWWSKFYDYLREKYPRGEDRHDITINKELKQYNATLFRQWNNGSTHVEFKTTEDYVMFVLRWS